MIGYEGGTIAWQNLVPGNYAISETGPEGRWGVTVIGSPAVVPEDGGTATATVSNRWLSGPLYLPLVMNNLRPPLPDLVVEQVDVTQGTARVVIKNQGAGTAVEEFWVDLYVDPDPAPTGVNQTWDQLSSYGIVWGVEQSALPLEPGGTITLIYGDSYYWESLSNFPDSLPAGTPIYAQVDSFNSDTSYGAVLESHEIEGEPYNNITGPVSSRVGALGGGPPEVEQPGGHSGSPDSGADLPPRP
jgi:hypothetical protein